MAIFFVDNENVYTYQDLFNSLNKSNEYYPFFKSNDIFKYLVNFIKALISNQSITLLDADVNLTEIDNVNDNDINVPASYDVKKWNDISEVINALQMSSSEIAIFTSGTTGQPKKVVHTVSTLTRAVRQGDKYKNQVWAYAYNPTHMAGLQVFFQAFINQNSLINVFNKTRSEIYRLIENYNITHISATPTFYRLLLPFDKVYPSVSRITFGGEKSDKKLYSSISQIFPAAKINNVYASTEAGSLFAAQGDCFQIPANILDKISVVDNELLIHKSLLGQSDSFEFDGEYYHSGDLIEWVDQEQGLFRFKSRKNELINVGGYKVNPGEVEEILLNIGEIRHVLVYGKANSVLGNILCADIQLKEGSLLTELEIKKTLQNKLQDFKIPRRIRFVDKMTLTRTGKLKRS